MILSVRKFLLFLVLISPTACGCGGEYRIMSTEKDDGTEISLIVNGSDFEAAPSWKPEEGEPPLSITAARKAVLEWAKTKYTRFDSVDISEISLKNTGQCTGGDERWLYVFDLRPVIEGNAMWGSGNWAAVLMDGTVIGPTESK